MAKLQKSTTVYLTEKDRIIYTRIRTTNTTLSVINDRLEINSFTSYLTLDILIKDLINIFGQYYKKVKAFTKLKDPKFSIGSTDSKESFDHFYVRFIAVVFPLLIVNKSKYN